MRFMVFLILSALLCSLIIQPSVAARDLAHDTQTSETHLMSAFFKPHLSCFLISFFSPIFLPNQFILFHFL